MNYAKSTTHGSCSYISGNDRTILAYVRTFPDVSFLGTSPSRKFYLTNYPA